MNNITLVMPYYRNPNTLRKQVAHWNSLPHWMHAQLTVRIVDDASPEPAEPILRGCKVPTELYRVAVDRPWGQHGARNLGAHAAAHDDDWLLMTDMDILVPEPVLCYLLQCQLDRRNHYFFGREFLDGREPKSHCNSFLVTKKNFWAAGGYEERFCGTYGGDGIFTRALEKVSFREDLSQKLIGLNDTISDCSTQGLGRKNTELHHEYLRRRDAFRGQPPIVLKFDWARVW